MRSLTLLVRFRLQRTNSLKCGSAKSAFCQGRIPEHQHHLVSGPYNDDIQDDIFPRPRSNGCIAYEPCTVLEH
jgi:hypothetical protein